MRHPFCILGLLSSIFIGFVPIFNWVSIFMRVVRFRTFIAPFPDWRSIHLSHQLIPALLAMKRKKRPGTHTICEFATNHHLAKLDTIKTSSWAPVMSAHVSVTTIASACDSTRPMDFVPLEVDQWPTTTPPGSSHASDKWNQIGWSFRKHLYCMYLETMCVYIYIFMYIYSKIQ